MSKGLTFGRYIKLVLDAMRLNQACWDAQAVLHSVLMDAARTAVRAFIVDGLDAKIAIYTYKNAYYGGDLFSCTGEVYNHSDVPETDPTYLTLRAEWFDCSDIRKLHGGRIVFPAAEELAEQEVQNACLAKRAIDCLGEPGVYVLYVEVSCVYAESLLGGKACD